MISAPPMSILSITCAMRIRPYLLTDSIQATVVQPTRSYLHERQRHGIHAAGRISDFLGSRALIQWLEAIAAAKLVPVYLLILCRIRPGFTQREMWMRCLSLATFYTCRP